MASTQTEFDPFTQQFTILLPDQTPMNVTVDDIQASITEGAQTSIVYGTQIGASLILLIILLLITKADKRRSVVFILNTIALLLNFFRCLLQSLYSAGPWWNWYSQMVGDFDNVPRSQYGVSIATAVLTFLLIIFLEASLIMQVHVVCVTANTKQKFWIMFASVTVSFLAVSLQFADMVLNVRDVMTQDPIPADNTIASGTMMTVTISICYFSLVFILKLGHAILERRKLGLKQFGPMQIIWIMGCQTLVVPVIFCAIQYRQNLIPQASSLVPTTVALFLPLSSLWASATVDSNNRATKGRNAHPKFFGSDNSESSGRSPLVRKFRFGLRKSSKADHTAPLTSPLSSPGLASEGQEQDLEKQIRLGGKGGSIELTE